MSQVTPVFKREFGGYFRSPVAYVFLVAFLVISVSLAFSRFGGFFQSGTASLERYFQFFPWLFLFFVPALLEWARGARNAFAAMMFAWTGVRC